MIAAILQIISLINYDLQDTCHLLLSISVLIGDQYYQRMTRQSRIQYSLKNSLGYMIDIFQLKTTNREAPRDQIASGYSKD